jgi:lipoprotein-anchoring transpeptidase ErfK/SrfK
MRLFLIFSLFFFSLGLSTLSFCYPTHIEETVTQPIFPQNIGTTTANIFIFDPKNLQWAVYDKKGDRVGMGKGVGGKDFCPDINKPCRTVEGVYTVFRTENEACTSKTFPIDEGGGAPMPHCMFFYKGYAIHGSNQLPDKNASHGCIRVSKEAAEWMNTYYIQPGSIVMVLPYKESV